VLNIQLLRFVFDRYRNFTFWLLVCVLIISFIYDRKTGHKKKVSSVVHFPQVLDMANYVQTSVGSSTYDLAAVLIHRGPSAYSGHYVGKLNNIVEEFSPYCFQSSNDSHS
jgi:hypothetical protein